jgi:hypothetical protein
VAIVERRFVVTSNSLVSRLSAPLMAFFLTFAPLFAAVQAAEDLRKVTVVSFGLFGGQGVFQSEATGAAQIVASRFGGGPAVVKFNTKKGGGAIVEALAATLQGAAKTMDAERDILFLILTSHGSATALLSRQDGLLKRSRHPISLRYSAERACDTKS